MARMGGYDVDPYCMPGGGCPQCDPECTRQACRAMARLMTWACLVATAKQHLRECVSSTGCEMMWEFILAAEVACLTDCGGRLRLAWAEGLD